MLTPMQRITAIFVNRLVLNLNHEARSWQDPPSLSAMPSIDFEENRLIGNLGAPLRLAEDISTDSESESNEGISVPVDVIEIF